MVVVVVVVVVEIVEEASSTEGSSVVVVVDSVTVLKMFFRTGLMRWKGTKLFRFRLGMTEGTAACAGRNGTGFKPGGGVLVMVTVVLSGVTTVNVMACGGEESDAP